MKEIMVERFWLFDDPRSYGARSILRGAVEGLEGIGKTVRVFSLDPGDPQNTRRMREDLLEFDPDAILLANHPASLFQRETGLDSLPSTALVWILDDPFMMGAEPFSEDEIVLIADPGFEPAARNRGAKQIHFLPVAAPETLPAEFRSEYAHPIAYVGSVPDLSPMRGQLGEETVLYLDRIAERKMNEPSTDFQTLLNDDPIAPGKQVQLTGQLAYYLYAEANRRSRLRFLEALEPLGLALYGNEAWKSQIQDAPLEAVFKGALDPFSEYPHLIHSAHININLRSLQGFTAPTQRDFLVPQLGGFLLSTEVRREYFDWSTIDPENQFDLGAFPWSLDHVNPEDLAQDCLRHLNESCAREEWTHMAASEISEKHTYTRRMEQMLAMIVRVEG